MVQCGEIQTKICMVLYRYMTAELQLWLFVRMICFSSLMTDFWISSDDERNPLKNTVRTDKSEVQIVHFDVSDIYIFKEHRIFRRLVSTNRVSLSVEQLMANINCGKWELEFINEYHSDRDVLYQCWIWMNHASFHIECQITLDCDKIVYHWNNLCENKPW